MALPRLPLLSCLTLLCGIFLQGCNVTVPRHSIGNWEVKPNYLTEFQHLPPGKPVTSAILNSCSDKDVVPALQCSGHGKCRDWFDMVPGANVQAPKLSFCECDRDYADPECRTARKSQLTAFVLSLFLGMFGVDQFYLGYGWYGVAKLVTLGGCGIWYLFDLCRIGSTPVLTRYNFRVAADLPHFAFVLTVVTAMLFFGFAIAIRSIQTQRVKKAHELLLLRMDQQDARQEEEEKQPPPTQPQYSMRQPPGTLLPTNVPLAMAGNFSGYGAMIPRTLPPRPMSMVPPVTLPQGPRTFMPPATLPFMPPVSVPVTMVSPPVPLRPVLPPTAILPSGPVVLPSMSSMPPTEYSVQFRSGSSPRSSISPAVLPVVQGFGQVVPSIRPVSSNIDMSSQARLS